jgi:hypothetical protein
MNNFVFGSTDPLLYSNIVPRQEYNEPDIKKQLDTVMMQYQQLQQNRQTESINTKDWLGDFDKALKSLDAEVAESLSTDQEFAQLNAMVQQDIQDEIMVTIKWKLNNKQETVQRVKRMMDIIDNYNRTKDNENKKNLSEIADYIQNYSDMTFNDYKKLKEANKSS